MPQKVKSGKPPGKLTDGSPKLNESPSSSISLTPELEQQFETELCWCVQQLQTALKSGKLNNKQVQDHTKALNTLMSNSAPMIKKRQVMRLSFGDYRAKMAAEEKKSARNAMNIRVKPAEPSKKSVFVKKATSAGNTFKFNFPISTDSSISNGVENIKIDSQHETKDFNFKPSDNTFRFGFDVSNES